MIWAICFTLWVVELHKLNKYFFPFLHRKTIAVGYNSLPPFFHTSWNASHLHLKKLISQMKMHLSVTISHFLLVIFSCVAISMAIDTLTVSQSITSNQTLTSAQNEFKLGFFSPGNSGKFYLGIWFNVPVSTQIMWETVWVADRENPLNDTSGVLRIGDDGNLILQDRTQRIIWSTNVQNFSSNNTVAQLLDSGNLVLRDSNGEGNILWESFYHPSHTVIPDMKLGWELKTGLNQKLTSWNNPEDPSPGEYTHGFDLRGVPQLMIWRGSEVRFRSGPWNGMDFGILDYQPNLRYIAEAWMDSEEVYYRFHMYTNASLLTSGISNTGKLQLHIRDKTSKDWTLMFEVPYDSCGEYGYCGPNAICTASDSRSCSCMVGYKPKNPQDWGDRVWSGGCIRQNQFNCSDRGVYKEYEALKMPDFFRFRVNTSMSMQECEAECSKNCSCTAYANSNATGAGYGCLLWFGDLIDVIKLPTPRASNQKLFIRVTSADQLELESGPKKKKVVIVVVTIAAASTLLLLVVLFLVWKRKSQLEGRELNQIREKDDLELPCFDVVTIARATQNFSDANKIGEGGFGPVYKGMLSTGQEIAVKRLSENSSQGVNEFRNEVMLIAKLQHRNLVRLLGYGIDGQEKMLIYEYMPNGSLNSYIFGSSSSNNHLLAWRRRFDIIIGIARGLLYLHRDSRLRIIHRDLKASNVLLDSEMNPKISDFGLARTFIEEQSTLKTRIIVGTYGYIPPEYIIDGIYSMKSDVFSFGVLVLEIISGKKNIEFRHPGHDFNLLGHAWQLWHEGRGFELIDPLIEDSFPISEVLRCIQVGLLCVQQRPEDRPMMSSVILMLDSESAMLQQPKHPGYYFERGIDESNSPLDVRITTINLTDTLIQGR